MTIHAEHPFAGGPRDPVRQFRGRMAAPVTIWATGRGADRVGWTVSSLLVGDGEPALVAGLLDEESDLAPALPTGGRFAIGLLGWSHRMLAEVFAGLAPAPGGRFRTTEWTDTDWGPVPADAPAWLGARVVEPTGDRLGWALLVRAEIEHAEIGAEPADGMLTHVRGRYGRLS